MTWTRRRSDRLSAGRERQSCPSSSRPGQTPCPRSSRGAQPCWACRFSGAARCKVNVVWVNICISIPLLSVAVSFNQTNSIPHDPEGGAAGLCLNQGGPRSTSFDDDRASCCSTHRCSAASCLSRAEKRCLPLLLLSISVIEVHGDREASSLVFCGVTHADRRWTQCLV